MIKIKDYAIEKGITTQAVYKHLNKHREELKDHIKKERGIQYLDDVATDLLDNFISSNGSMIVFDSSKDEEIKQLKDENRLLMAKIIENQEREIEKTEMISKQVLMIAELQGKIALLENKPKKKFFWQKE